MSELELQRELDELGEQEKKLVKKILECREKLKDVKVAEQKEEKVRIFDWCEERVCVKMKIEDLRKKLDEKKQEDLKENLCELEAPCVLSESSGSVCYDSTVSSRNVVFVQGDKRELCIDNGSVCKLKAPVYKLGDDFCTFLLRFEQYIILSKVRDNLDCRLSSLIEDDAMFKKVRNIRLCAEERQDVRLLLEAVKRELYPPTDTRIMRTTFHKMKQEDGENVEQFAQRVIDEAEKIFPDKTERESAAMTALISGVSDVEIKRRLLASNVTEDFVSLAKLAVQEEHISAAIGMKNGSQAEPECRDTAPVFGVSSGEDENQGVVHCQRCGKRGHVTASCWTNLVCQLCDRTGHVASVCWDLAAPEDQSNVSDSSPARSERREPVVCYRCQEPGHIQRFCSRARDEEVQDQYIPSLNEQRTSQQEALNGSATGRNPDPFSRVIFLIRVRRVRKWVM